MASSMQEGVYVYPAGLRFHHYWARLLGLFISANDRLSENPLPTHLVLVIPIAVISLFTLAIAVLGYLFVYSPLHLYLDGEKKKAVNLFLQTFAVFAGITLLILLVLVFGISSLIPA